MHPHHRDPVNAINRRRFLKGSLLSAAALSIPAASPGQGSAPAARPAGRTGGPGPGIVDTNVHLGQWPTRRLKYGDTAALVAKLRRHRVEQAWAGSFEGLLHKNMLGVNERLAAECRERGDGVLVPFGSVNPVWPDWEEDLRICHEVHRMPGIRLHPTYQNYTLDHPDVPRLLAMAAERGLIVQLAALMEDPRVHHTNLIAPEMFLESLIELTKGLPRLKLQLLGAFRSGQGPNNRARLAEGSSVCFDISNLESNGGLHRIIEGRPWEGRGRPVPLPVERILFGSHAPYMPVENALLKLFESPLTREQFDAVAQGNARRLLTHA
jgi:hypothetical protein